MSVSRTTFPTRTALEADSKMDPLAGDPPRRDRKAAPLTVEPRIAMQRDKQIGAPIVGHAAPLFVET